MWFYFILLKDLFLTQRKIMTRPSVRGLFTAPASHTHSITSSLHVAKQQLLCSSLLTSHRNYSSDKQDDTNTGDHSQFENFAIKLYVWP